MKNMMELEVFVIKITYHYQSATYVISLFFDILLVISTQFVFFPLHCCILKICFYGLFIFAWQLKIKFK